MLLFSIYAQSSLGYSPFVINFFCKVEIQIYYALASFSILFELNAHSNPAANEEIKPSAAAETACKEMRKTAIRTSESNTKTYHTSSYFRKLRL